MSYKMAILPGLMLTTMIDAGDAALAALKSTSMAMPARHSVARTFSRFGSTEWDALRTRFLSADATQFK